MLQIVLFNEGARRLPVFFGNLKNIINIFSLKVQIKVTVIYDIVVQYYMVKLRVLQFRGYISNITGTWY